MPTWVQGKAAQTSATGQTSFSLTFTSVVTSGNRILGAVFVQSTSNSISSVKDDKGNTYTILDTIGPDNIGATRWYSTFVSPVITNSPQTITLTISGAGGASQPGIVADEYSNLAAGGPDAHAFTTVASSFGSISGTITSTSVTATFLNDLLYCAYVGDNIPSILNPGTGFTQHAVETIWDTLASESLVLAGTGAQTATWTVSSNDDLISLGVILMQPTPGAQLFAVQATGTGVLSTGAVGPTWNPSDEFNILVSNANLKATNNQAVVGGIRSTGTQSTGKVYFEMLPSGGGHYFCGIANATWSNRVTSLGWDPYSFSFRQDGGTYYNATWLGFGPTVTGGQVVGIMVDCDARTVQGWNGGAIAGPFSVSPGLTTPIYVAYGSDTASSAVTVNFGDSPFTYGVPVGYKPWDGVQSALYVAQSGGSDSNPGTFALPFATISQAASVASPGTTVFVEAGSYGGGFTVNCNGTASGHIAFVSSPQFAAKITWQGIAQYGVWQAGNYVDFVGFEIDGTVFDPTTGWQIAMYCTGTGGTTSGCKLHDITANPATWALYNTGQGSATIVMDGFRGGVSANVINCIVYNSGATGSGSSTAGHGIYGQMAGSIVNNNLIWNSAGCGIVTWHGAISCTFLNNTIQNSRDVALSIGSGDSGSTSSPPTGDFMLVGNNIVADSLYGIVEGGITGPHNQYWNNIVYNITNTVVGLQNGLTATGTITSNPQFQNSSALNFHLAAGSPAIGAGIETFTSWNPPTTTAPGYDLDSRTRANPPAIGAFEGPPPLQAVIGIGVTGGLIPTVGVSLKGVLVSGAVNTISGNGNLVLLPDTTTGKAAPPLFIGLTQALQLQAAKTTASAGLISSIITETGKLTAVSTTGVGAPMVFQQNPSIQLIKVSLSGAAGIWSTVQGAITTPVTGKGVAAFLTPQVSPNFGTVAVTTSAPAPVLNITTNMPLAAATTTATFGAAFAAVSLSSVLGAVFTTGIEALPAPSVSVGLTTVASTASALATIPTFGPTFTPVAVSATAAFGVLTPTISQNINLPAVTTAGVPAKVAILETGGLAGVSASGIAAPFAAVVHSNTFGPSAVAAVGFAAVPVLQFIVPGPPAEGPFRPDQLVIESPLPKPRFFRPDELYP